jgi:hypothetical protein
MKYKLYRNKFTIFLSLLLIVGITVAFAASGQVTFTTTPATAVSKATKAYAASQVDTLRFSREAGLSGLAFTAKWKDSVSLTNILLRRVVDGKASAFITTDSIMTLLPYVATTNDTTLLKTITLAPLCDEYWVIVTYAGSGQGTGTNTAVYEFQKQYAK